MSFPGKEQTFQGHQPIMAQQDTIRTGTKANVKAWQDNPVGGIGSQQQAKESDTQTLPLSGHPGNNKPTAITYMQKT